MKKYLNIIFISIIIIVLLIPLCKVNKKNNAISLAENRELAKFPNVFDDDGNYNHNIKSEFTNWINDNIGYRDKMLEVNAELQYRYFNRISSSNVILGKDNWLFYSGEGNISIKDYQANKLLNEDELKLILENVKKLDSWCINNDMDFVLMLIPNKEYIYEEYLPYGINEINKLKNIDLVVNYIKENSDIKVVYPKEALLRGKEVQDVYYKYDTHWNDYGAYIGYEELMKTIGYTVKPFDYFSPIHYNTASGDLSQLAMLNGKLQSYEEIQASNIENIECTFDDQLGNFSYQKYVNNKGDKNIFFMGDSFRMAIKTYLNESFNKTEYVHRSRQNFNDAIEEDTDIFVYQVIERYIDLLKELSI